MVTLYFKNERIGFIESITVSVSSEGNYIQETSKVEFLDPRPADDPVEQILADRVANLLECGYTMEKPK